MKREVYEYVKQHPTQWFTVEDLAKHFNTEFEKTRNAISRCATCYHLLEQKEIAGRLFVKFDEARFKLL